MRGVVALLLTLITSACQLASAPADLDPSLNVADASRMLATDQQSYRAGTSLSLLLRNPLSQALGYNLCFSVLEQRAGKGWKAAASGKERVCTAELRILQPGASDRYSLRLDPRLPAGEYRLRTSIEKMDTGAREEVVSNTFQVTR